MRSIPIEAEREVRLLLRRGKLSHRKIALLTGVGRTTVDEIARGRKRHRTQSMSGSRVLLLGPRKCPKCKAEVVVWPCPLCYPEPDNPKKAAARVDDSRLSSEAPSLIQVVVDLWELHRLRLIPYVPFVNLAHRARDILLKLGYLK